LLESDKVSDYHTITMIKVIERDSIQQ